MAYSENLADRVRERFAELSNVEEKEMMGGLVFMKGYVMIDETGIRSKKELYYWIDLAIDFNEKAKSSKRVKKK